MGGFVAEREIQASSRIDLERTQPGERLVDVPPFCFELLDATRDLFQSQPVLGRAGRVGFVEAQIFPDSVDGEAEPTQFLNELQTGAVAIAENPGSAGAGRRNKSALLVKPKTLRGERKFARQFRDAVEPRTIR